MKKTNKALRLTGLILILAVFFISACGRKGSPRPPEVKAPSQVKFLTATAEVSGVIIQWTVPDTKANGDNLDDLNSFLIMRADYDPESIRPNFSQVGEVTHQGPLKTDKGLQQYSYKDSSVVIGKRYLYQVVPVNNDNVEGDPGRTIRLTFKGQSSLVELF